MRLVPSSARGRPRGIHAVLTILLVTLLIIPAATAQTLGQQPIIAPPSGLTAAPGPGKVTLQWQASPATSGVTPDEWRIYRAGAANPFVILPATTLTFTDAGRAPGVTYSYEVTGSTTAAESTAVTAQATTPSVPDAVTTLVAEAGPGAGETILSWEPATTGAAPERFHVLRALPPGAFAQVADVTEEWYFDSGLGDDTTYTYVVRAVNAVGESLDGPVVTVTTFALPGLPLDLVAAPTVQRGEIELTWSPPADDGDSPILGYVVSGGPSDGPAEHIASIDAPGFVHTGLADDTEYAYRVFAFNQVGGGFASTTLARTIDVDLDDDGVIDADDNCIDTPNPLQQDLDLDGAGDACDDDLDGDGFDNSVDLCPGVSDPGQEDLDGDLVGDACDGDRDSDGVENGLDVCPDVSDDQADLDLDGVGDACDPDWDGDGVDNAGDVCPRVADPAQEDLDADLLGDACDADDDADGAADDVDLCPRVADPLQEDLDADLVGDACDPDIDGDGVDNAPDVCPRVSDPGQEDLDADLEGDACDPDWDGDLVDNALDVCPRVADPTQDDLDADGAGDACDPDVDGDGYDTALDCADTDAGIHPGAMEVLDDGVDQDCDGVDATGIYSALVRSPTPLPLTVASYLVATGGVTDVRATLPASIPATVDVLVLVGAADPADLPAIQAFVSSGGSLLMTGAAPRDLCGGADLSCLGWFGPSATMVAQADDSGAGRIVEAPFGTDLVGPANAVYVLVDGGQGIQGASRGTEVVRWTSTLHAAVIYDDAPPSGKVAYAAVLDCAAGVHDSHHQRTLVDGLLRFLTAGVPGQTGPQPFGATDNCTGGDDDTDGFAEPIDCADTDPSRNPGVADTPYDGADNDCDGADLTDVDGDGVDGTAVAGGSDCVDTDATIHPGATDARGDGIDQDCSGFDSLLAPTDLTLTRSAPGTLELSWTGVAGASGYLVEGADAGAPLALLANLSVATVTFTDTALGPGRDREYRVVAYDGAWLPGEAATASGRTFDLPGAPTLLTVVVGPGAHELDLAWSAPLSDGGLPVTAFRVYGGDDPSTLAALGDVTTRAFAETTLANGATRSYAVAALSAAGEGPATAVVTRTLPLVALTGRTATYNATNGFGLGTTDLVTDASGSALAAGAATGSWTFVHDLGGNGILSDIAWASSLPVQVAVASSDQATFGTSTAIASGAQAPPGRFVRVTVTLQRDLNGTSPVLTSLSFFPDTRPSVPVGFAGVATTSNVTLTWLPPLASGDTPLQGYALYAATGAATPRFLTALDASTLTYVDGTYAPGTTRTYRLAAVNRAGEGPATARLTVVVLDPDADGDTFPLSLDCDDGDAATHPGAREILADGKDQDCNGVDVGDPEDAGAVLIHERTFRVTPSADGVVSFALGDPLLPIDRLDLAFAPGTGPVDVTVGLHASPPSAVTAAPGSPLAYFGIHVRSGTTPVQPLGAAFGLRVAKTTLDAAGMLPGDLTVLHHVAGNWTTLSMYTPVEDGADQTYEVVTPSFSEFAYGRPASASSGGSSGGGSGGSGGGGGGGSSTGAGGATEGPALVEDGSTTVVSSREVDGGRVITLSDSDTDLEVDLADRDLAVTRVTLDLAFPQDSVKLSVVGRSGANAGSPDLPAPGLGFVDIHLENETGAPLQPLEARVDYRVALSTLEAAGARPEDVMLLHEVDARWIPLEREVLPPDDLFAYYRAITPSFSEFAIIIDTVAPSVTVLRPADGTTVRPLAVLDTLLDDNIGLRGAIAELDGVNVTDEMILQGKAFSTMVHALLDGPLAEGRHVLKVSAIDLVGHDVATFVTFTTDATPPTVVLTADAVGLTGLATDAMGKARLLSLTVDGENVTERAVVTGAGFTYAAPGLDEGAEVVVDVVDEAGNRHTERYLSGEADPEEALVGASLGDGTAAGVVIGESGGGMLGIASLVVGLVGLGLVLAHPRLRTTVLKLTRQTRAKLRGSAAPAGSRYTPLREIGEGGFGVVVLARDELLGREVVVKRVQRLDAAAGALLVREARAASRVQHPNLVAVYDVTRIDGDDALVMEYVPGGSLETRLKDGPLTEAAAVEASVALLRGLSALHASGVLHRDVKPGNILLGADGTPKLTDFGIARAPDAVSLTAEGVQPGTLLYMSPEQARGEPLDVRSDVYAMTAVLYEMLTGRHYLGDLPATEYAVRRAVVEGAPVLPVDGLRAEVNEILAQGLAKDPAARFADADALRRALESLRDAGSGTIVG